MKKVNVGFVVFVWLLITNVVVMAQSCAAGDEVRYRIMFYNVENLFDPLVDSLNRDEEFTPGGERRWTNKRMYDKINKIYKVIMAVGEYDPPAIIGLSEIENLRVLQKLIYETPLKNYGYRIVHHESPDRRGIDVALLYRADLFRPFSDSAIALTFADDTSYRTRDILYVKGLAMGREMLHIFVNHWPSRYGGYMNTVSRRNDAATLLRRQVDSLTAALASPAIIIMGDFNDDPTDESMTKVLQAKKPQQPFDPAALYNLMLVPDPEWPYGSLKYRESWNHFDQLVVSGILLADSLPTHIKQQRAHVFHADFLLEPDATYLGYKPYRTYLGFRYRGGFSDHLPVYFDLLIRP